MVTLHPGVLPSTPSLALALASALAAGCGYDFDSAFSGTSAPDASSLDVSFDDTSVDSTPDSPLPDSAPETGPDASPDAVSDVPPDLVVEAAPDADAALMGDVAEAGNPCSNGKLDGNETGIDCGGSCPACAPEICTNGLDDDKDGKADCADDECGQYQCVVASGVYGWTGPVVVNSNSGCDEGLSPVYTGGWLGQFTDPGCGVGSCACGEPTGASCSAPSMTIYADDGCTGSEEFYALNPGQCRQVPISADSVRFLPGTPVGGTCTSSGSPGARLPPQWTLPVSACSTGAGCPGGTVCTTDPTTWGAQRLLCLVREGSHTCPPGWSTEEPSGGLYTSFDDQRVCSSCECSPPSGGKCSNQEVSTFDSGWGCMGSEHSTFADSTCRTQVPDAAEWDGDGTPPLGMTCAPSAAVQGSVQPSGLVTVCCRDPI